MAEAMATAFKTAVSTEGLFDGLMSCVIVAFTVALPVMVGGLGVRKGTSSLFGFLRRV